MDCKAEEVWKKFEDSTYYTRVNLPARTSSLEEFADSNNITASDTRKIKTYETPTLSSWNRGHDLARH